MKNLQTVLSELHFDMILTHCISGEQKSVKEWKEYYHSDNTGCFIRENEDECRVLILTMDNNQLLKKEANEVIFTYDVGENGLPFGLFEDDVVSVATLIEEGQKMMLAQDVDWSQDIFYYQRIDHWDL